MITKRNSSITSATPRPKADRQRRRQSGVGAMEVATSSFLMVVVGGLAADITLLNFACGVNDSACRDACRAAAQTSTYSAAQKAAQAQLKVHATDGWFISQPTLSAITAPDFVYNDYAGSPPPDTSPYVTVTTFVNVRVPCPIFFFGVQFLNYTNGGKIQFKRTYTFPIIKQKFYG